MAQLGGAHVACEWVSNVLTKILQRPRLGAYLEQSTRYIAYDAPMPAPPGGYRYYRDAELGPEYARRWTSCSRSTRPRCPGSARGRSTSSRARGRRARAAHARAIKAKALDLLRGLLPASSLSHMGIFATGQTYEQLILHLLAHPLPEARTLRAMILEEIKAVMPSFVARVERPDRGGEWIAYLESRARAGERWARRLGHRRRRRSRAARRSRCCASTATRTICSSALLFEAGAVSEERCAMRSARSTPTSAPRCSPISSASAPTAATAPGAASRRCATASRSSPTTARSATSSATGC